MTAHAYRLHAGRGGHVLVPAGTIVYCNQTGHCLVGSVVDTKPAQQTDLIDPITTAGKWRIASALDGQQTRWYAHCPDRPTLAPGQCGIASIQLMAARIRHAQALTYVNAALDRDE